MPQSTAWAESHLIELTQDLQMSRAETDEAMSLLRAARANERELGRQLVDSRRESDRRLRLLDKADKTNRALRAELAEARAKLDEQEEDNARLRGAIVALSQGGAREGTRGTPEEQRAVQQGPVQLARGGQCGGKRERGGERELERE